MKTLILALVSILAGAVNAQTNALCITPNCGATLDTWRGIGGATIADLMSGTNNLANTPDKSERLVSLLEAPTNASDDFGSRMSGWLMPPITGSYEFWNASDDQGEFWLSSNDNPANKNRRCYTPGAVSPLFFTAFPEQKSAPISLVAGQPYYYEVRLCVSHCNLIQFICLFQIHSFSSLLIIVH